MNIKAKNPEEYISKLPEDRQEAVSKLCEIFNTHLPKGFEQQMSYGMLGWVVPKSIYTAGYHCDTSLPLPFINMASQKNYIAVYHMGLYANASLHKWFTKEYAKRVSTKLDMGKSCIRLKKPEHIPFDLFEELATKMSVQEWINLYEQNIKK